jgi:hypothetical protein
VQYTLEPLVYVGPAEGLLKEQWSLRSAKELLDLKICDMACGSGAFLVQACRYMAARLLEAWDAVQWANPGTVRINDRLKALFPPTLPFRFRLREISGKPDQLGILLIDQHKGHTPLGSRGAGVRRLMNITGALLRISPESGHTVVLYDEPETSLHADAQHMLRRLLEALGALPTVQVVYTTHSPAMINTLRPHSIRVLERRRVNDKATSIFVNQALAENYSLVRSSLGISPADSLLYSPITIVVEGPTEVRSVPFMLKKLADAGVIEPGLLEVLLPQTHILDGEGSSFEYMVRLAKSQNAHPVLFLDGDKANEAQAVRTPHPDVAVIILDVGKEFEELVPRTVYIQAVAELLEDTTGAITARSCAAGLSFELSIMSLRMKTAAFPPRSTIGSANVYSTV